MIRYKCTKCGTEMGAPGNLRGTVETCPECGEKVRVPDRSKLGPEIIQRREQFASTSNPRQGKKQCPKYSGLVLTAITFLVLGTLLWIVGLFYLWDSLSASGKELTTLMAMAAFIGGLQMDAIGYGLLCLKDIATNTFKSAEAANTV